MSIRVLLCDDHRLFREGVCALVEDEEDMHVVGEAGDGLEALRLAKKKRPDVVVLDISMRGLNGIGACDRIGEVAPHARVLALSMHSEGHFVSAMLSAGAQGYILKDTGSEELIRAIRIVHAGDVYVAPAIAGTVVRGFVRASHEGPSAFETLTQREREVLQLLAEGLNLTQIGERLHLSGKTIHSYRASMTRKLGIHSVAALTKYAVREGLTSA